MLDGYSTGNAAPPRAVQLAFDFEQRWRDRRGFIVRSTHELFDPRGYGVDLVRPMTAKRFCEAHHYSGSMGSCVVASGLFSGSALVGVAVFGNPVNERTVPRRLGLPPQEGLELNRLVLLDSALFNAESWFLARSFPLVYAEKGPRRIREGYDTRVVPGVRGIVSFADPEPRTTLAGQQVFGGHLGTVYQALSASFVGRSTPHVKWFAPDGAVIDNRALSKVRKEETGAAGVEERLMRYGAEPRRCGEAPKDWLKRIRPSFRLLQHPGNLIYVWGLDRVGRRSIASISAPLPYPRREDLFPGVAA
jgi:hypothetical protein